MVDLDHGQLPDLERQSRRKGRLTYRKAVAFHVRVELTLDEGRQLPIHDPQARESQQDKERQSVPTI